MLRLENNKIWWTCLESMIYGGHNVANTDEHLPTDHPLKCHPAMDMILLSASGPNSDLLNSSLDWDV